METVNQRRYSMEMLSLVSYRCVPEMVFEKFVDYHLVQSVLGSPLQDDKRWKPMEMQTEECLESLPFSEVMST